MNIFHKVVLAGALAAAGLTAASPAMADPYHGRHRGGDTAEAAVAGGIIGLALGAAIASSGNRGYDDGYYYYDRRYPRYRNYYVYRDYPRHRDWRHDHWREHRRYYRHHGDRRYGRGW